ncbi:MAG: hypothetical protein MJ169_01060 [Treponema sp.]|nr:hypothetical protein [Treponema sp.]
MKPVNKIKFFLCALGIVAGTLFCGSPAFAEKEKYDITSEEDAVILEKTNNYYNSGKYEKSVETINIGIELHREKDSVPDNIKLMAEASYYAWVNSIFREEPDLSEKRLEDIMRMLSLHPEAVSVRTQGIIEDMFAACRKGLEKERMEKISSGDRKGLAKVTDRISKLEQNKKSLDDVLSGVKSVLTVQREITLEKEYRSQRRLKFFMLTIYILIFIGIVVLIIVFARHKKRSVEIQNQFETTMKVVAIMQKDIGTEKISLVSSETKPAAGERSVRKSGLSDAETEKRIAAFFEADEDQQKFLALQNQCAILGDKIDKVTGRKRNSKKVSELVFKLCKAAGMDDQISLMFYCAAMVYDAGFLGIDRNVLLSEHLTIKERLEVRSHVQKGSDYYDFISDDIRRIFADAAEFHHENFDGKGYSANLKGARIPLVARFIRVAESYISLVNIRAYRQIMDTESALEEMKKQNSAYDPKILALLEKVV